MKNMPQLRFINLGILMLILIFSVQACGPKPLASSGSGSGTTTFTDVEDFDPDNFTIGLCFDMGGDTDGDGYCDAEEVVECVNDPNCVDDPDNQIHPNNNDYKNGGALGRWLKAAAGVAAVAFTADQVRRATQQRGLLYDLISDNVDNNGIKALAVMDSEGYTITNNVLNLTLESNETFHKIGNTPRVKHFRTMALSGNKNFATYLNGRDHANSKVTNATRVKKLGKEIVTCVAGNTAIDENNFIDDKTVSYKDENGMTISKSFSEVPMSVSMNNGYLLEFHKSKKTKAEIRNYCETSPNGGVIIGLQLPDKQKFYRNGERLYFVNALKPSFLASGVASTFGNANSATNTTIGYNVNYLIRQIGAPTGDPLPGADITTDTQFDFRRFNDDLGLASQSYGTSKFSTTKKDAYNTISSPSTLNRAKFLLGHTTIAEETDTNADPRVDNSENSGTHTADSATKDTKTYNNPSSVCASDPLSNACAIAKEIESKGVSANITIINIHDQSTTEVNNFYYGDESSNNGGQ